MNRLVLIGIIVAALVLVAVLWLIRSRRLQERHALFWIIGAIVIAVLGISEPALNAVSDALGIAYPPSALFLIVVAFLGLALLDAVITISKQTDRIRSLAQDVALLSEQVHAQSDADPHTTVRDPSSKPPER